MWKVPLPTQVITCSCLQVSTIFFSVVTPWKFFTLDPRRPIAPSDTDRGNGPIRLSREVNIDQFRPLDVPIHSIQVVVILINKPLFKYFGGKTGIYHILANFRSMVGRYLITYVVLMCSVKKLVQQNCMFNPTINQQLDI